VTQLIAQTGATLGDFEELSALFEANNGLRTLVNDVPNPYILDILDTFDLPAPLAALNAFWLPKSGEDTGMMRDPTEFERMLHGSFRRTIRRDEEVLRICVTGPLATSSGNLPLGAWWLRLDTGLQLTSTFDNSENLGAEDVVVAVRRLETRLGLPLKDVINAAKIRRSSFFYWENHREVRPRVASQGRIWELAQVVEDLEEVLGPSLRSWILASDSRRKLLRTGAFDRLLDEAQGSHSKATEPAYVEKFAVGADDGDVQNHTGPISHETKGSRSSVTSVTSRSRSNT